MSAGRPRSLTSVLRWMLPLTLLLGCTEHASQASPAPSPSPATKAAAPTAKAEPAKAVPASVVATPTPTTPTPTPTPTTPTPASPATPTDAATPTTPVTPTPPTEAPSVPGEPRELTDAERIDAYVASCSHEFTVLADDQDDSPMIGECKYYEWDQNCSPDPSGCFDKGQECGAACGGPCGTCQTECVSGCDQCKAACAPGATDCIRKCAEARLACRTKCMDAKSKCETEDCPKQQKECDATFNAKRKKSCPDCKAISSCIDENMGEEDYDKICAREFPKAKKVCFDWCVEYYEEGELD